MCRGDMCRAMGAVFRGGGFVSRAARASVLAEGAVLREPAAAKDDRGYPSAAAADVVSSLRVLEAWGSPASRSKQGPEPSPGSSGPGVDMCRGQVRVARVSLRGDRAKVVQG